MTSVGGESLTSKCDFIIGSSVHVISFIPAAKQNERQLLALDTFPFSWFYGQFLEGIAPLDSLSN